MARCHSGYLWRANPCDPRITADPPDTLEGYLRPTLEVPVSEQAAPDAPDNNTEDDEAPDLVAEADEQTAEEEADDLTREQADDTDTVRKLRREARNYRTRLRQAEEQIRELTNAADAAREAVNGYHRDDAERIAKEEGLLHPEDFWLHYDLERILDGEGAASLEQRQQIVRDALGELRKSRPEWFDDQYAALRFPRGAQAMSGPQQQTTFGQALKKAGAGR